MAWRVNEEAIDLIRSKFGAEAVEERRAMATPQRTAVASFSILVDLESKYEEAPRKVSCGPAYDECAYDGSTANAGRDGAEWQSRVCGETQVAGFICSSGWCSGSTDAKADRHGRGRRASTSVDLATRNACQASG